MSSGAKDARGQGGEGRVIDLGRPGGERGVSPFELERYLVGELDAERRREIESLLAADATLAAELDALRARDAAFRVAMPFERFLADHEARIEETSAAARVHAWWRSLRLPIGGGVIAAAAAAVALAVFLPEPVDSGGASSRIPSVDEHGRTRLKGDGARIGFFVQVEGGARWGADGEELRAGDRIQLAVQDPEGARSMVIVGIDGRGEVSTYLARRLPTGTPKGESGPAPRVLEQSLVLDDAVGAERFFVLYGMDADVEKLEQAAVRAARELSAKVARGAEDLRRQERLYLSLDDVEQGSVHIIKVPIQVRE